MAQVLCTYSNHYSPLGGPILLQSLLCILLRTLLVMEALIRVVPRYQVCSDRIMLVVLICTNQHPLTASSEPVSSFALQNSTATSDTLPPASHISTPAPALITPPGPTPDASSVSTSSQRETQPLYLSPFPLSHQVSATDVVTVIVAGISATTVHGGRQVTVSPSPSQSSGAPPAQNVETTSIIIGVLIGIVVIVVAAGVAAWSLRRRRRARACSGVGWYDHCK